MTYSSAIRSEVAKNAAASPVAPSRLELNFATGPNGRTYIKKQYADYPFHVCRAHYFDAAPADMATLYLQSCSGGLFENDRLSLTVTAEAGTAAHITSQASTIVHSSRGGGQAEFSATIVAGPKSIVEYLPDPMILFPQSRLRTLLELKLDKTANVILSDCFLLHDPLGTGALPSSLDSTISLSRLDGTLVARDRMRLTDGSFRPGQAGAFGQWTCHGMLMVFSSEIRHHELSNELREAVGRDSGAYAGVSTLPNEAGVWARFLTSDAVSLREAIIAAWKTTRKLLCGSEPMLRRK